MNKSEYKTYKSSKQYNLYKIKEFNYNRSIDKINHYNRNKFFSDIGLIFRILFLLLSVILFIRVISALNGRSSSLNFSSFLDFLSNLNSFEIKFNINDFKIGNDWGLFNGFRDFLNKIAIVFGVIIWLFTNIINVFNYLFQFIRFLFA